MLDVRIYDPRDWYWTVGDKVGFYSSRRRAYVADDDADYLAFLTSGAQPTRIASEDELRAVLKVYFIGYADDAPTIPLASVLRRLTEDELAIAMAAFQADPDMFRLVLVGAAQETINTGSAEMAMVKQKLQSAAPKTFTDARIAELLAAE